MANSLGSMVVRLGADITDFEKEMSKAQKVIGRVDRKLTDFGKSMTAKVTLPIAAAGAAAVKFATDMDSLRRGLTAVTGSAGEADRQLKRLREVAKTPGLGFEEAIAGSIRLQAVGISAGFAERALSAFGNAVATTGGGKSDLDRITVQLGQLSAKGKVMAQDLRPIIEAAPLVGKALRDAFGTVDTEEIQKLGLTTEQFMERLVSQLETLPRVTGGARNSFDNLTDSLKVAGSTIGGVLLPPITAATDKITEIANRVQDADKDLVSWGVSLALTAAAIGPLILLLGKLTTGVIALSTALKVGLLPLVGVGGAVIIGLSLLSSWFIKNKLDAMEAAGATDQLTASLGAMSDAQLRASRAQLVARGNELREEIGRLEGGRGNSGKIEARRRRLSEIGGSLAQISIEEQRRAARSSAGSSLALGGGDPDAFAKRMEEMDKRLGYSPRDRSLRDPEISKLGGPNAFQRLRSSSVLDLGSVSTRSPDTSGAVPVGKGGGAIGEFFGGLKDQASGLLSSFGPLAAAAAALKPVFEGIMEALGPVLSSLAEPLKTIGRLIGASIAPALKMLQPVLDAAAKGFSYVTEAVGWLLRAIGKAVNWLLPGNPANGLVEWGQSMMDAARASRNATQETERFAAALSNVPNIISIARMRHGLATAGGGTTTTGGGRSGGGGVPTTDPMPGGGRRPYDPNYGITINVNGVTDPNAVAQAVGREIDRRLNRGGTTRLSGAFA